MRAGVRADVLAGLTAAAVVAPKAMAYATIAGLPVQIGLYTAIVPMLVYAALGTSRPLSVSTTTTIAILTAAALGQVAPNGSATELIPAVATLAMLVGLLLVLASAVRLGFVANFISEPVLTGFKSGIGLVIVVDQIPKLLGIHITKAGFFRDLLAVVQELPATSMATLVLALLVLALIFALEHFAPRAPAPLLAIGLAIAASAALNLSESGVAVVGAVSGGLPAREPLELLRDLLRELERLLGGGVVLRLRLLEELVALRVEGGELLLEPAVLEALRDLLVLGVLVDRLHGLLVLTLGEVRIGRRQLADDLVVERARKRPPEYLQGGQVYITCEVEDRVLPQVLELMGEDHVFYASDIPHGDREPQGVATLRARTDLSATAKGKILYDNAVRFYGL